MSQAIKSEVTNNNIYKTPLVAFIADEEYSSRVAVDLIFKIIQAFNEYIYNEKIEIRNITTDTTLKFKFIDTIIAEWQNPNESKKFFI